MILIVLSIITAFVLTVLQIGIASHFPLILVVILFLSLIRGLPTVLPLLLFGGLMFELFSQAPPIALILALSISVLIVTALFKTIFTHQTLFSLFLLGFIGGLTYSAVICLSSHLAIFLGYNNIAQPNTITVVIEQALLAGFSIIVLILITRFFQKRLRPYLYLR